MFAHFYSIVHRCLLQLFFVAVWGTAWAHAIEVELPAVHIAQFSENRAAAISYTFDDGLRDQFTLAVPMLNEQGFRGTFFIIPGKVAETLEDAEKRQFDKRAWGTITWAELQQMASQGHEIASHTWSHRAMPKLTAEEMEIELRLATDSIKAHLGSPALTLAFPFNQSSITVEAAALRHHVAYRGYQIGISGKTTEASLNAWADKLVLAKKHGVLMAHAIAKGYAALSDAEILRAHLKHVKTREHEIWVDTFANHSLYAKLREEACLTTAGKAGQLTCTLTSKLDAQVYHLPLTLVIHTAATSAKATRAGKELPLSIQQGSIMIQAAPGPQPICITW